MLGNNKQRTSVSFGQALGSSCYQLCDLSESPNILMKTLVKHWAQEGNLDQIKCHTTVLISASAIVLCFWKLSKNNILTCILSLSRQFPLNWTPCIGAVHWEGSCIYPRSLHTKILLLSPSVLCLAKCTLSSVRYYRSAESSSTTLNPSRLSISWQHMALPFPLPLQLYFLKMAVTGVASCMAFSDWLFSVSSMYQVSSTLLWVL